VKSFNDQFNDIFVKGPRLFAQGVVDQEEGRTPKRDDKDYLAGFSQSYELAEKITGMDPMEIRDE